MAELEKENKKEDSSRKELVARRSKYQCDRCHRYSCMYSRKKERLLSGGEGKKVNSTGGNFLRSHSEVFLLFEMECHLSECVRERERNRQKHGNEEGDKEYTFFDELSLLFFFWIAKTHRKSSELIARKSTLKGVGGGKPLTIIFLLISSHKSASRQQAFHVLFIAYRSI